MFPFKFNLDCLKNGNVKTLRRDKATGSTTSQGFFHGHECHIPAETLNSNEIKCGKIRNFVLDLVTVHTGDIRSLYMYRSYAALREEKYRQYKLYPFSIHPFSKLRTILECLFSCSIFLSFFTLAIHYSEAHPSYDDIHLDIKCAFDFVNIVNIITNFFTGYVNGKSDKYAILDLKKIACRYAKTWFIIDLFASIGFIPDIFNFKNVKSILLVTATKMLRIPILLMYVNNILTVLRASLLKRTAVEIIILLISFVTWNIYFQFSVEYMVEGTFKPKSPRNCSWITIAGLWDQDGLHKLFYAFDRSVGLLRRNTNMNLIKQKGCFENFSIISWVTGRILVFHCVLKYVIALFGTESARARYYIMTKEVETYMIQRKFPPTIRKKILKFYAIRYQSNYFAESRMISCLSGQLREDILMHTGRQLVRELNFLKQLPRPLLMQIGLKLKVVIFIAGDIIFKINTVGDCLYFIDKGTVAIYSESGKEICHLEDGDFFGEIALVMKQRFRTASAVAVTNCELFRLDREDFDSSIACYPTVYEDIKKVATSRYERTCVLDEHHRAELRTTDDYVINKAFL